MIKDILSGVLQECEIDCLSFSDVVFKVDFGPWKAGEKYNNIVFNFEKFTITEYDDNGEIVKQKNIEIKIKE